MNHNEAPIIVGLDIGTTKIAAIAGRKNEFGKLEILGVGKQESTGVLRGVVSNIEKTVKANHAFAKGKLDKEGIKKIVESTSKILE